MSSNNLLPATLSLLLAVVLAACLSPDSTPTGTDAELRLYIMDCGWLRIDDVSMFSLTNDDVATTEMFVPCYLIEHSEGRLLWDAGLPLDVQTGERKIEGGEMKLDRGLEEQLAELDLTPSDVDLIAMSHLHFDHSGQANLFSSSTHVIQRAEHDAGFAPEPTIPFFERALYSELADAETLLLEGDHDVFGDGRVLIKSAPGHTPGHQVLFLDLQNTGPLVLSGDLYHFPANRYLRRPPTFNHDAEQTLESMEAIETFLEETGAQLWIEHDAVLASTLRKSPEFFD